jgi:hypothetical protein
MAAFAHNNPIDEKRVFAIFHPVDRRIPRRAQDWSNPFWALCVYGLSRKRSAPFAGRVTNGFGCSAGIKIPGAAHPRNPVSIQPVATSEAMREKKIVPRPKLVLDS